VQVGEVPDPEPVWASGAEVALDEVGPALGIGVGLGRAPSLAAPLGALDLGFSHQPLHAALAHLLTLPLQGDRHPPVVVGAVVALMHRADALQQALVGDRAG
jgi:hypothetical protein